MTMPEIVSREEWLATRREFLVREKEFTRARDALNAERRALPMVRVEQDYVFERPGERASLLDLFDGRRQLIVHHVMWLGDRGEACPSCTYHMNELPALDHLHRNDTTLVLVSRGPVEQIEAYRRRMGWPFPWYSSLGSDFNYDYHVTLDERVTPMLINYRTREEYEAAVGPQADLGSELPGVSVFLRDGDAVFHTYSAYARGIETLMFSLNYLDLTPLGRNPV
ncbi:DUF899 domain-containing protein [Amycolatopsis anabasis]|uniref:DUF899 domain-containing protein n=1 Tax=Amycolatopsis anabasis TaxID=1840409 RepID=UPI00131EA268|nr:DUF899 domain-containing protein [Amycolatopsis anabasis]